MNEFLVHSQNRDTPNTLYNFIYTGSEFNFCSCDWALNENACKHVFKVQIWAIEHDLDINTLTNVSSLIIDKPVLLVNLNQTTTIRSLPEDQANNNHVNILSNHVDPHTSTLSNLISEVDRLQVLHVSINKKWNILNNLPTNVDHYEAIDNLFCTLETEINKKIVSYMSLSKIMTKRQHYFFIPLRINHNFKGSNMLT
jgi:ribosome-associated translation inhibitor RaiA